MGLVLWLSAGVQPTRSPVFSVVNLLRKQLHFSSLCFVLEQPGPGTLPSSPNEVPDGGLIIPLTSSHRGLAASLALNRGLRLGSGLSFL